MTPFRVVVQIPFCSLDLRVLLASELCVSQTLAVFFIQRDSAQNVFLLSQKNFLKKFISDSNNAIVKERKKKKNTIVLFSSSTMILCFSFRIVALYIDNLDY